MKVDNSKEKYLLLEVSQSLMRSLSVLQHLVQVSVVRLQQVQNF